jgi:hypothetical protein
VAYNFGCFCGFNGFHLANMCGAVAALGAELEPQLEAQAARVAQLAAAAEGLRAGHAAQARLAF